MRSVSESNAITGAMRKELMEVFERRIGPDEINIGQCLDHVCLDVESHTCINRNMNMTTFMLSFRFPGSFNTATDTSHK